MLWHKPLSVMSHPTCCAIRCSFSNTNNSHSGQATGAFECLRAARCGLWMAGAAFKPECTVPVDLCAVSAACCVRELAPNEDVPCMSSIVKRERMCVRNASSALAIVFNVPKHTHRERECVCVCESEREREIRNDAHDEGHYHTQPHQPTLLCWYVSTPPP
jgi:hypothetical protein